MPSPHPNPLLLTNPSGRSIKFNGSYLNLTALGRMQNVDSTALSRIFNGKREPTLSVARKLASALSMGLEEFLDALEARIVEIQEADAKLVEQHETRLALAREQDESARRRGEIVEPRTESVL